MDLRKLGQSLRDNAWILDNTHNAIDRVGKSLVQGTVPPIQLVRDVADTIGLVRRGNIRLHGRRPLTAPEKRALSSVSRMLTTYLNERESDSHARVLRASSRMARANDD